MAKRAVIFEPAFLQDFAMKILLVAKQHGLTATVKLEDHFEITAALSDITLVAVMPLGSQVFRTERLSFTCFGMLYRVDAAGHVDVLLDDIYHGVDANPVASELVSFLTWRKQALEKLRI